MEKMEDEVPEVIKPFESDYLPPSAIPDVTIEVGDEDWDQWAKTIEFKVSRLGQLVIGVSAAVVVTLGFSVLMGRVVIKLVEGQKLIVEHLNGATSTTSDSDVGGVPTRVSYTRPSNRVDTSEAVVDEDLKKDLEEKLATSTEAEIPDDIQ